MAEKKFDLSNAAKIIGLALGVSVVLAMAGQQGLALIGGGGILALIAVTDFGKKNFGLKKDLYKGAVFLLGFAVVVGGINYAPNPVSSLWTQATNAITGLGTGGGKNPATIADTSGAGAGGGAGGTTPTTAPSGSGRIIATTATLTITAETLTNKTLTSINPGGYRKQGDSYISLSFSSGSASVTSLDPTSIQDKVSVGTDGTYYWNQVDKFNLNGLLSPALSFKLVPVETADTLNLYDSLTNDMGNQSSTETDRPNQQTVGAGGVFNFVIRPEVTSTATGLRQPAIGFEYNVSTWDTVEMPGLNLVDCPTRLVTASNERALSRCYDLGATYLLDGGSKGGIPGAVYGYKDYNAKATALSGINPGNITGHCIKVYIFDKDEYFKSPTGQLFFLDPERGTLNLGKTTQTTRSICVL